MELTQCNRQWSSRPADQRFTSLSAMADHFHAIRRQSRAVIAPSKSITLQPADDNQGLSVIGGAGVAYAPTNWAFGQLCQRVSAPAGYLRALPTPMAADCLNYGLKVANESEDVGLLLYKNGESQLRAATGPKYGRIWNADVTDAVIERCGDGTGRDGSPWSVPGHFGKPLDQITTDNTTLFASDRDMFVFLADEQHRIEIPNRRNGAPGSLARGFFLWNSEEGKSSFGLGTFLFDYACCNRIVWGAENFQEITIRHTSGAPDRWLSEVTPSLISYANSSSAGIEQLLAEARAKRLDTEKADFLATRFGKRIAEQMASVHELEEGRPIETLWDAATAATALARGYSNQDTRIDLERKAGDLLRLAA